MKSIALLSGGLDSLVSMAMAQKDTEVVLALNFDYGQKAAAKEKQAAEAIAKHYGIPLKSIKLPWLAEITKTALVSKTVDIPLISETDMERKLEITQASAKAVWVPNRNGVFVNIAAAFAESMDAQIIVAGFNSEEAATFPDNSIQFINSTNVSFRISTLSKPKLVSYIQSYNKNGVVTVGVNLNVPFSLIYSCYTAGSKDGKMCGRCESCSRVKRAFHKTNKYELINGRFEGDEDKSEAKL